MQNERYALVALDMDGTLLNTNHTTTPYTREVLAHAAKAGRITALATGRCLSELKEHLPKFESVRYVINENGASIYDNLTKECISRTSIPHEAIEFIMDLCEKNDMIGQFFIEDQSYIRWHEEEDLTPYHIEDFRSVFVAGSVFKPDLFEDYRAHHRPVDKVNLYFRTVEERARIRRLLAPTELVIADSIGLGLEMSAPNVTKASGLIRLCEILNVPLNKTIAIGDAANDVEIIQAAGLGIAMGNAIPEIKALAGAVTEDCDHDGAAKAILRYLL